MSMETDDDCFTFVWTTLICRQHCCILLPQLPKLAVYCEDLVRYMKESLYIKQIHHLPSTKMDTVMAAIAAGAAKGWPLEANSDH